MSAERERNERMFVACTATIADANGWIDIDFYDPVIVWKAFKGASYKHYQECGECRYRSYRTSRREHM